MKTDPALEAIITYTEGMCRVAIAEATGYYNSRTAREQQEQLKTAFIETMNKLETEE